ncbi:peptide deformylase [bacterium]|nr:peptide deformylase [bacterium]MBU1153554.1 peptide deformylase [bacterium]MBU2600090.1 peptide deformylase [bacterium]
MAILPIKKYPDLVLRERAKEVNKIKKRTISLINNMIETMLAKKGIGLAANQVGVLQRIIIVDVASLNGDREKAHERDLIVLINPEILFQEGETMAEEGCLSFPKIMGKIKRAWKIRVKGLNINGEEVEIEATNWPARVFSHEIDHLNGVLFIDRMDKETKEAIKDQLGMLKKKNQRDEV